MSMLASAPASPAELRALRAVATFAQADGATTLEAAVKLSCADLADRLDTSTQTASRRLRALEEDGLVTRETVGDGQWIELTADGRQALRREYETYRQLFEGPPIVEFVGHVTGGMGEGRHYITLSGYHEQFVERLGYEPFPGTLNLELTEQSIARRASLEAVPSIPIDGWADEERTYGPATCYPAVIEGPHDDRVDPAHVIVPDRTHHDESSLEVIAPVKLRDELDLADSDRVLVRVGDLE